MLITHNLLQQGQEHDVELGDKSLSRLSSRRMLWPAPHITACNASSSASLSGLRPKRPSVHQRSQANQWALHAELLAQARTKHLGGLGCAGVGVGFHGLLNLQESARPMFISSRISHHL
jgi:hypothetical protein